MSSSIQQLMDLPDDSPTEQGLRCFSVWGSKPLIIICMAYMWLGQQIYKVYKMLPINLLNIVFGVGLCLGKPGVHATAPGKLEAAPSELNSRSLGDFNLMFSFIQQLMDLPADSLIKQGLGCFSMWGSKPLIIIRMAYIWLGQQIFKVYKMSPISLLSMVFGGGLCLGKPDVHATAPELEAAPIESQSRSMCEFNRLSSFIQQLMVWPDDSPIKQVCVPGPVPSLAVGGFFRLLI